MKQLFYTVILAALMAVSCTSSRKEGNAGHPVVTVSIEPQRWLLEQLAGDRVDVRCLMDKNADPENFDPTVSALRDVESSSAYFCLGNNAFEAGLLKRLSDSGADIMVVDTSRGVNLLTGTHCGHSHEGDGHSHGEVDPHTWQSVENMRQMAKNMAEALAEIDPAGAEIYIRRLDSLERTFDALDLELRETLAPVKGASFMVWHPSLSYFAHDYDLNQIALGSEGKETSPAAFARTLKEASDARARALIIQPHDDLGRSEKIAEQAGARVAVVNIHDYDWPATMRAIAAAVAR